MLAYVRSSGKGVPEQYPSLIDALRFECLPDVAWEDQRAFWDVSEEEVS